MKTVIACLLLAAMWPAVARAVDLKDYKYVDETKKVTMTLTFSAVVDAQFIHNYAGNFVEIVVKGLKLPKQLTKQDHTPTDKATESFYQSTHFAEVDGEGHIRIQLGKYAGPGDVQVVSLEDRIVVDLVKPYYKLPAAEQPAVTPEDEPADGGFIADEAAAEPAPEPEPELEPEPEPEPELEPEPEPEPEPQDSPASAGGNFSEPFTAPAGLRGETPITDEPASEPVVEETGNGGLDDLPPAETTVPAESAPVIDTAPPAEEASTAQPVRDFQATPSYQLFDIDDVPVAQLQLRNMPFNEALMELTAGSGFNVIVGAGVSDELMTLDFRQKELSLKRALDLLCMAYDLGYTVEDDAIVIKAK